MIFYCENNYIGCNNVNRAVDNALRSCLADAGYDNSQMTRALDSGTFGVLTYSSGCYRTSTDCQSVDFDDEAYRLLLNNGYTCQQLSNMSRSEIDAILCRLGYTVCTGLVDNTISMDTILCLLNNGYTLAQISSAKSNGTINSLLTATGCGTATTSPASSN